MGSLVHYHRCPECGYIMESRRDYDNRFGKYMKDLICRRCHHQFTLMRNEKKTFGPLIGTPQPVEFDWDTKK